MKKRWFKPKDKGLPKGYDSKLEYELHQTVFNGAIHHLPKADNVPYTISHLYEPDFVFTADSVMYVVETKGRMRDSTESAKYRHIIPYLNDWNYFKESGCTSIEFIILFENSATPMPFSKKRKDGTKLSHGEWATKNKIKWLCCKKIDTQTLTLEGFIKLSKGEVL